MVIRRHGSLTTFARKTIPMSHGKTTGRGLILLGMMALGAPASSADTIRVEAESLPVPLHRPGASPSEPIEVDAKVEASAVEPIGDGKYVLVAHDKASELYLVETATGKIVGPPVTSGALPATTASGPKFEGMARDSKGNFYAIGSHSGKTDDERGQRAHLVRFRFQGDQRFPTIDPASVRRFDAWVSLKAALGKESGEVDKLKIEGLAIRELPASAGKPSRTEVVVGLREPADLVRVFAAEIKDDQPADSALAFEKLFAFDAGRREGVSSNLTSLLYLPDWRGFFVVTATEDKDNAFHGNTLWFLRDDAIPRSGLAKPERAHDFEVAMKAEGIADLPQAGQGGSNTTARLVVVFDNDAKSTHMPSRIQTLRVSRRDDRD
jgi:hypothetical protein